MRTNGLVSVVVVLSALGLARGPALGDPGGPERRTRVAFVILEPTANTFFARLDEGAQDAAADLGADLIASPAAFSDQPAVARANMLGAIHTGWRGRVDALVIAPFVLDLGEDIVDIVGDRLPIVTVDSQLDPVPTSLVGHVGTDNVEVGIVAAEGLAEAMPGGGPVVVVSPHFGRGSLLDRHNGFVGALPASFTVAEPEITSLQGVRDAVLCNPGAALFSTFWGPSTFIITPGGIDWAGATADACPETWGGNDPRLDERVHVSVDLTATLASYLEDGRLDGVVSQDPYRMGYEAVSLAVEAARSDDDDLLEGPDQNIVTPLVYVTAANLDENRHLILD